MLVASETRPGKPVIVVAEDSHHDRLIIEEVFGAAEVGAELRFVESGEELLDYLLRRGA
jgi:hypothetical protein